MMKGILKSIMEWKWPSVVIITCFLMQADVILAQYEENPLKGKRWMTFSAGLNDADFLSWHSSLTFSKRGETMLTQFKLSYGQELIKSPDDSCMEHHNRLTECALLWGDGWAGKKWFFAGAAGFGLNIRMFCRRSDYVNEYITAVTVGVPMQAELGLKLGKRSAITLMGVANLNFRQPYFGGGIGFTSFFPVKK